MNNNAELELMGLFATVVEGFADITVYSTTAWQLI